MQRIIWEVPIKTVSEANISEHWTKKSKRHRQQQFFIRQLFHNNEKHIDLPCSVKMTRLGGRYLDADENLPMAFKYIKDEIAECLFPEKKQTYFDKKGKIRILKGRCDDSPLVTWKYAQEKSKNLGIRIEIESLIQDKHDHIPHE